MQKISNTRKMPNQTRSTDSPTTVTDMDVEESDGPSTVTIALCLTDLAPGSIGISQLSADAHLLHTERRITFLASYGLVVDLTASSDCVNEILKWASWKYKWDVDDLGLKDGFRPVASSKLSSYSLHSVQSKDCQIAMTKLSTFMERFEIENLASGGIIAHLKSFIIDKETPFLADQLPFPDPDNDSHENRSKQS